MKPNSTNATTIKSPESMTDADIFNAVAEVTGGHRGHWATYEIPTEAVPCLFTVFHSQGWTDAAGRAHENAPDFLHSLDALLPVIDRLSFDSQLALHRRVRLCTPPRAICLEILRELGHFDP